MPSKAVFGARRGDRGSALDAAGVSGLATAQVRPWKRMYACLAMSPSARNVRLALEATRRQCVGDGMEPATKTDSRTPGEVPVARNEAFPRARRS